MDSLVTMPMLILATLLLIGLLLIIIAILLKVWSFVKKKSRGYISQRFSRVVIVIVIVGVVFSLPFTIIKIFMPSYYPDVSTYETVNMQGAGEGDVSHFEYEGDEYVSVTESLRRDVGDSVAEYVFYNDTLVSDDAPLAAIRGEKRQDGETNNLLKYIANLHQIYSDTEFITYIKGKNADVLMARNITDNNHSYINDIYVTKSYYQDHLSEYSNMENHLYSFDESPEKFSLPGKTYKELDSNNDIFNSISQNSSLDLDKIINKNNLVYIPENELSDGDLENVLSLFKVSDDDLIQISFADAIKRKDGYYQICYVSGEKLNELDNVPNYLETKGETGFRFMKKLSDETGKFLKRKYDTTL